MALSIPIIRILFFCLIPVGSYILIRGIKLLKKSLNGRILLEFPYTQQAGTFSVSKPGNFSIWLKAPILSRTPIDLYQPQILNLDTKEELPISYSYTGMQSNSFSDGRAEIFTFAAQIGNYNLSLIEGNSTTGLDSLVTIISPAGNLNLSNYTIQVRESQPQYVAYLAIPIIILGGAGILGGFVIGLLADQLFS